MGNTLVYDFFHYILLDQLLELSFLFPFLKVESKSQSLRKITGYLKGLFYLLGTNKQTKTSIAHKTLA